MINWFGLFIIIMPIAGYLISKLIFAKQSTHKGLWMYMFVPVGFLHLALLNVNIVEKTTNQWFLIDSLSFEISLIYAYLLMFALWMTKKSKIDDRLVILILASGVLGFLILNNMWMFLGLWVCIALYMYTVPAFRKIGVKHFFSIALFAGAFLLINQQSLDLRMSIQQWVSHADEKVIRVLPWALVLMIGCVLNLGGLFPLIRYRLRFRSVSAIVVLMINQAMSLYVFVRFALPLLNASSIDFQVGLSVLICVFVLYWCIYIHFVGNLYRLFSVVLRIHTGLICLAFLSGHSMGWTGGIIQWFTIAIGALGFGLTIVLTDNRTGIYHIHSQPIGSSKMPRLAMMFLIFGLVLVDFPTTLGFIGEDLIIHTILSASMINGMVVLIAIASASVAIYRTYVSLYLGRKVHGDELKIDLIPRESLGFFIMLAILIGVGLFPQKFIDANKMTLDSQKRIYKNVLHDGKHPITRGYHDKR